MRVLNSSSVDPAVYQKLIDDALASAPVRPTARTREWFRVRAAAPVQADDENPLEEESDDAAVDIDIYAEIGSWFDGLTAKDFSAMLDELPSDTKKIRVHVNSLGGDVFDALAIANALQRHPAAVEMHIEGVAASAATIITQGGGDAVKIAENALVMIHPPMTYAPLGNAKDLRAQAEMLDRVQAAIVTTYQRLSPLSKDDLSALMDASTWMDATEALANGFATEVTSSQRATASISPRALATLAVPEKYKPAFDAIVRPSNDLRIGSGADGTSIEEFCQAVYGALRAKLGDQWPAGGGPEWFVVQTYEDAVVINRDGETWEYPITATGDGDEVTLGEPFEVEMVWVPAADGAAAAVTTKPRATAKKANAIAVQREKKVVPPTGPAAPAADVVKACATAGLDLIFAQTLIADGVTADSVAARVAAEKAARAAAVTRAQEIRGACAKAGHEDLADGYAAGGMTLDQVKSHLTTITAKLDKVEIDSSLKPVAASRQPVPSASEVYAQRRNGLGSKETK